MKIHFFTVWSNEKNIGKEYNDSLAMIPEDDWACFIDGDAMFSTTYWGGQLYDIVESFPDVGCFTAITNRVNNSIQCYGGKMSNNFDLKHHWKIGNELYQNNYGKVASLPKKYAMSGVLMLTSKKAWNKVKFREQEKLAGIDNHFHWDLINAGFDVMLMKGVYIIHYYSDDRKHLK